MKNPAHCIIFVKCSRDPFSSVTLQHLSIFFKKNIQCNAENIQKADG